MSASLPPDIADSFKAVVARTPDRTALLFPRGLTDSGDALYGAATYRDLDDESDRLAHGLARMGLRRASRVLMFVPPGDTFIALTFSLIKLGAVPVFIDPGMERKQLLHCIAESEPEAMIAVPAAHLLRVFWRPYFKGIKHFVTVGRRWVPGGVTLNDLRQGSPPGFPMEPGNEDDPLLIGYTSGSTGTAKGVVVPRRTVNAQIHSIRDQLNIGEGDISLQAFAPFALRDIAIGVTCILPAMDPMRPAAVDPEKVVAAIQRYGATYSFGSPAFWGRVAKHCAERRITLPSLRHVIMAGAPVSPDILRDLRSALVGGADASTPYGSTEAQPLTTITGAEILGETAQRSEEGAGTCVGRPLPGVTLKIIEIRDEPIPHWDDALILPANTIGEIVVKGDVVTTEYHRRDDQTKLSKIREGSTIWHRMGDAGYVDGSGRLWFCGRKSHRVVTDRGTLFTVPCEAVFNRHPGITRSALVGVGPAGSQRPVIVIEPKPGRMPRDDRSRSSFVDELLTLGRHNEITRKITDVLFHPGFPVDIRHNAKIKREKLAEWASHRTHPREEQ